ncbi:MAG: hypothetical protein F2836_02215 [Actinobacteria bacterium]|uniref:Unannotated protein n=1 Tax=freshwater metagenome TaxID=449393 RepID=A0A6J7I5A9_9ZZZZ|nr:hypothetical protein [Actinomycetota bacterium]
MSKTDQMRALREAKFTRANSAPARRASAAPATVAPLARPVRPASPVEQLPPAVDVVVEAVVVEAVVVEAPVVEAAVSEAPPAATSSFEVPTLDIPFPAAVPKVRETPNPATSAKFSEVSPSPTSEQIIIPALDLAAISPQPPEEDAATVEPIETPDTIAAPGHGIEPGQPIAAYTPEDLAAVVRWVNRDTPPQDAATIVSAVMTELGFKRKGKKITDAITSAAASIGALADEPAVFVPSADAIAS